MPGPILMQLHPGQSLNHKCGLRYKNVTFEPINLPDGVCPQCGHPIEQRELSGGTPRRTKWLLIPPHGTSFKNELGSEVSIEFEAGREAEMFQALQLQLNQLFNQSLPKSKQTQNPSIPTNPRVSPIGLAAPSPLAPTLSIDQEGTVHTQQK